MKRITPRKVTKNGRKYWRVIVPKALLNGEGRERFFGSKDAAVRYAETLAAQSVQGAAPLMVVSHIDQARIYRCLQRLGGIARLEQATEAFLTSAPIGQKRTVSEVVKEVLKIKESTNRRPSYLQVLRSDLTLFETGREGQPIDEVTAGEINEWLHGNPGWGQWRRMGLRSRLATLFGYALRCQYIKANPILAVDRILIPAGEIGIISVDEAKVLLKAAEAEPHVAIFMALQMFGFLRPLEAFRLDHTKFAPDSITVTAAHSKTRLRRIIPINSTLKAWLGLGIPKFDGGYFALRWRVESVREAAGIKLGRKFPWTHDCLRHSCVSCAYPIWGARQTSEWAGHSEAILFRHYRSLVHEAEAKCWWEITPASLGWSEQAPVAG